MEAIDRLAMLSSDMDLEPAEDAAACPRLSAAQPFTPDPSQGSTCGSSSREPFLSQAVLPNGKRITLLKSLLTSACERNCYYCPFRAGRDFRRLTLKPDEMARTFMGLYQAGIAEGIFLSSGITGGGLRTQDKLLDTAEILRHKYHYQGYIHLKLMPGAEKAQIERAMQLSDRVSINLEAPNPHRLGLLAPRKTFEELLRPLRWVEEIRRTQPGHHGWNGYWPSVTTQFVVGAVGETDLELLSTTHYLHRQVRLRRAYFSAFRPISDTPLEDRPAENPLRKHRLYQASFLLRDYGFELEDMPFDPSGGLPLDRDPKTAWAQANLVDGPIEINRAGRHELLRIPGIGPKGVKAILSARTRGRLRSLDDLRRIGINPTRLAPYVLLDGARPSRQLPLF